MYNKVRKCWKKLIKALGGSKNELCNKLWTISGHGKHYG